MASARVGIALCSCLALLVSAEAAHAAPAADGDLYVLLPEAASTLAALLDVDRPLQDGKRLSAAIEKDRVRVWVGARSAPELSITLRHQSAAGFPAMPVGDTALVPEPGPVPAALLEQVADRLRAGEGKLPWTRPPAPKHPERQPQVFRKLLVAGDIGAASALIAATPEDRVCALAEALRALEESGDWATVRQLASAIRARSPMCHAAWATALFALARQDEGASAVKEAQDAVARFANRPLVLEAASAVFMRAGRPDLASKALYAAGKADPADAGRLRQLAAAVLASIDGDPVARQAEEARLKEVLARTPNWPVARFVLGVLRHYEADFEASNALLLPLAEVVGGDRLAVYLALNDFNLGRREAALARLAEAASGTDDNETDPDVWYARAEIQRDTERKQAIADLQRYLRASGRSPFTSADKRTRVRQLIDALQACERDGTARCDGPWEHPRDVASGPADHWPWAAGALAFLLVVAWWWRRKSR